MPLATRQQKEHSTTFSSCSSSSSNSPFQFFHHSIIVQGLMLLATLRKILVNKKRIPHPLPPVASSILPSHSLKRHATCCQARMSRHSYHPLLLPLPLPPPQPETRCSQRGRARPASLWCSCC